MDRERDEYSLINFEETELRLGLPCGNESKELINNNNNNNNNGNIIININEESSLMMKSNCIGKRCFSETQVDLKLNLSSNSNNDDDKDLGVNQVLHHNKDKNVKPPSKAQVVGWPPVRSCRKNIMAVPKNKAEHEANPKATINPANLVKVSMDGAPYLRKVDLKLYKSYQELSNALGKMFSYFTIGNCGSQGVIKDFMNERKLIDLLNGSEYVATYEDKDGDWMLVGDVPWEMFVESCRRLQIMKGSEAIGLAPRAVEKCKNRT